MTTRLRTQIAKRWGLGIAAALLLTLVSLVDAQQPARGQQPPARGAAPRTREVNPLGQPLLDPAGHIRDDAFIHQPLLPEDRKYSDIDGMRMKGFVQEVAAISLKDRERTGPKGFWGRNQGTAGHLATQDWVENYFKKNGLTDVRRQPFDLEPQWVAKDWNFTFTSNGKTYPLTSVRPATNAEKTPAGGLDLELVWVATGTAADFLNRDVRGKAVLIQDIPEPGVLNHSMSNEGSVERAFEKGAAAVGVVYGISDNFSVWEGGRGRPGFAMGFEDGKVLRDLLGQGQTVKVKYTLDAERVPGLKSASVWGTLPGTTDEDVLIIAHMDGFFQGALDNGSGLAVMIGLLEHYAKVPQSERRRTIRFLGSVGHHSGPGTRWLHDNRQTALAKTALMINLEHVAVVRTKYWGPKLRMTTAVAPMRWWVNGSRKVLDIALASWSRFNVGITADMDGGASGEMGSIELDAPSMQVITSPEVKHTEQDTPDWIPAVGLEQVARAYAKIIDEVNKLDRKDLLRTPAAGGPTSAR